MKKNSNSSFYFLLCTFSFLFFFSQVANAQTGCVASFNFQQASNSLTLNFTDASTSPNTLNSWLWNFGDGGTSASQNPSHTYAAAGVYNICLTIHDAHGCSNTICHHVTVNAVHHPCQAAFLFHTDPSGNLVFFTNTSTGTTGTTTFYWTFGDGGTSTNVNPHHTYNHTGHYTICLFLQDSVTGCTSHYCHGINVFHVDQHHPNNDHHPQDSIVHHHNDDGDHHHGGKGEEDHSGGHSHPHHSALAPVSNPSGLALSESGLDYFVNFPNPFQESTTIQYELLQDAEVVISIWDLRGSQLSEVVNVNETSGIHNQVIQTGNLVPGIYFMNLKVDGQSYLKKIAVVK